MSKFANLQFTSADVIKLLGGVIAFCALWFGKLGNMEAKLDKVIATQEGVDKVQDVKIARMEQDLSGLLQWRSAFSSQPAEKPKGIRIDGD